LLVGFLAAKAKDSNREKRRKLDKNIFHKAISYSFGCSNMSFVDFEAGRKVVEIKNRAVILTTRIRSLKRLFPTTLADNSSLVRQASTLRGRIFDGDKKFMDAVLATEAQSEESVSLNKMRKIIKMWDEQTCSLCFDLLAAVADASEKIVFDFSTNSLTLPSFPLPSSVNSEAQPSPLSTLSAVATHFASSDSSAAHIEK
jgi:hypothetical protein